MERRRRQASSDRVILVVAAVLRRGEAILLVKAQGPRDPAPRWMLPGGVVNAGEDLVAALHRELREETGLEPTGVGDVLYVTQVVNPSLPTSVAVVLDVSRWHGTLAPADPDGLVLEARFVPIETAIARLEELARDEPAMGEPAAAYLRGDGPGRVWIYAGPLRATRQTVLPG